MKASELVRPGERSQFPCRAAGNSARVGRRIGEARDVLMMGRLMKESSCEHP
jgi:hypothetical protein